MSVEEKEELVSRHYEEGTVLELKLRKSRCKAAFTTAINRFKEEMQNITEADEARKYFDKIDESMEMAKMSVHELCQFYNKTNRTEEMVKTVSEIELIDEKYETVVKLYHILMDNCVEVSVEGYVKGPTTERMSKSQLGHDLWNQLKRVTIPVFDGDKTKYPAVWMKHLRHQNTICFSYDSIWEVTL